MTDNKCKKCGAEVRPHLINAEGSLCFACVTRKSGRASRLRRLMSLDFVDVGPGGNCIYCRQSFENNRIGIFLSDGKICEGCARAIGDCTKRKFSQIVESLPYEWLLKSSGRILGPFNHAEVESRLSSREVVPLDEVAKPFERWKYLRDEVAFAKVIEQLRLSSSGGKSDDTSTNTEFDRGGTGEITVTQDPSQTASITDPADTNLIDVQARVVPIEARNQTTAVRSYGSTTDSRIESEIRRSVRWVYFIPMIALLIVVCGWIYLNGKVAKKGLSFDEHYRLGLEAKDIGDHLAAIKNFRAALELRSRDIDTKLQVSALMVYFEGQTTEAQRLLGTFIDTETAPDILKEANVILALAHMLDGQFTSAEEYLIKALNYDSSYTPALINRAYIHLKQEKYLEAIQALTSVRDPAGTATNAAKNVLLPFALMKSKNPGYLRAAEIAERQAQNGLEFSQESKLLKILSDFFVKNELQDAAMVLDFDPELDVQFIPNLLIYPRLVEWSNFMPWCEEAVARSPKAAANTALQGYCEMRSNKQEVASRHFHEAELQDPANSLFSALNAYNLMSTGNDSAANAELKSIAPGKFFKLPFLLRARDCFQHGDFKCAKENYESILALNNRDLSAISGLAQTYSKIKDSAKANEYLNRGLAMSVRYKPLLWLKKELSGGKN